MVGHRSQDRRRGLLIMKESDIMGIIDEPAAKKKAA
jgi:hypothetical protein